MNTPNRKRLPARRGSQNIEANVGGHTLIITTGEYADGTLGEIFVDMHKEGAAFRSLMNCFAILVSLCLQHGVPLALLVKRFSGMKFEPAGVVTGHARITHAASIVDFIFQALGDAYGVTIDSAVPAVFQVGPDVATSDPNQMHLNTD